MNLLKTISYSMKMENNVDYIDKVTLILDANMS